MHCTRWLTGPLALLLAIGGCGTESEKGTANVAEIESADHSWGNYHWARTSNPFTLKLGDNVSAQWDAYLGEASSDWSASSVLDTTVVPGGASSRNCRRTNGRVEVCNAKYGSNGWLGVATIWISGGEHITAGTVKLNDSYFDSPFYPFYNTPEWRRLVMCQEVAHTFGLDHQDEDFGNLNLGSCMDYTSNPLGPPSNEHPNAHDFEQLETIYAHLDGTTTVDQASTGQGFAGGDLPPQANDAADDAAPPAWGRLIRRSADGRLEVYELDLGGGHKVIRFVIWA